MSNELVGDILIERFEVIACAKCSQPLDTFSEDPFTLIHCPSCGAEMRIPARFANFILLEQLGKGGMGSATQAACREHGCIYIQTVGGAAAWIAQCVRRVGRVWFEREFGATEAMWELAIEGLIGRVAIDTRGESLFTRVEQDSGTRLRALLAGKTEET